MVSLNTFCTTILVKAPFEKGCKDLTLVQIHNYEVQFVFQTDTTLVESHGCPKLSKINNKTVLSLEAVDNE